MMRLKAVSMTAGRHGIGVGAKSLQMTQRQSYM